MFRLSYKEIRERMIEWRNLKKLHINARETIEVQNQLIKAQSQQIQNQEKLISSQAQMIETLQLQIEELKQIIFGRKKKKTERPDDNDNSDNQTRNQPQRPSSSYHRPVPQEDEVTKEEFYPMSSCNTCHHKLAKKTTAVFYEEDIPLPIQKEVIRHTIEKGWCPKCKKFMSDMPLPSAPVILGKQTKIYVCYLSIILNLSFEKIRNILSDTYNLHISDGEISNILEKEATKLRPEYERLEERIRSQPAVHYDETSWPVQKEIQGSFGWVMTGVNNHDTIFLLGKSRGKGVAEKLKDGRDHIGITDDYGAYRHLFSKHQLCWAHPLRKLRDLSRSEDLDANKREYCSEIYQEFKEIYQEVEALSARPISQRKLYSKELLRKFILLTKPRADDPTKLQNIKKSLVKNKQAYFTCLDHENIPLTNNNAERALRPLVLKRKISYGSKTEAGAERTSILASVLLSLWWSKPGNFFNAYRELRGV